MWKCPVCFHGFQRSSAQFSWRLLRKLPQAARLEGSATQYADGPDQPVSPGQPENIAGTWLGARCCCSGHLPSENQFEYPCQGQQSHDKNNGDNPQNYFHFISLTIKKHSLNSIGEIQRCAFCWLRSQLWKQHSALIVILCEKHRIAAFLSPVSLRFENLPWLKFRRTGQLDGFDTKNAKQGERPYE